MPERKTVSAVIAALKPEFGIRWIAGEKTSKRQIIYDIGWGSHPTIVGHLNLIHPNRVQVLGAIEIDYIDTLSEQERTTALEDLFGDTTFVVIIADNLKVPDDFIEYADRYKIALLGSTQPSNELVTNLRYRLASLLSDRRTLHGVFMEVISVGVLLTGESSVGKSELALELITRGHRLIADDAPEFVRITPDIVSGHCPPLLQDLLEVRGLGILNIRHMYGDGAVKHSKYLRLIINLVKTDENNTFDLDRLSANSKVMNVMGVDITEVTLPIALGRNIAVMVEAAVRNYLITLRGYDANEELINRQKQIMEEQ